jgi:hypothetical protein
MRRPDRFVSIDPSVFLDPEITSVEYVSRYGDGTASAEPTARPTVGSDCKTAV